MNKENVVSCIEREDIQFLIDSDCIELAWAELCIDSLDCVRSASKKDIIVYVELRSRNCYSIDALLHPYKGRISDVKKVNSLLHSNKWKISDAQISDAQISK